MSIIVSPVPLSAPFIGTATTASSFSINVPFTQPIYNGGIPIIKYIAISNPGSITSTLTQSGSGTITVSGLTPAQFYTFTVTAYNAFGPSPSSCVSNSIAPPPIPPGSQSYTTAGSYTWIAPLGVVSVSVFVVGGGSGGSAPFRNSSTYYNGYGGSGGGTYFENNMAVTPGTSYTVVVGSGGAGGIFNSAVNSNCHLASSGGTSYFCSICRASASGGLGSSQGAGFSTSPGASCRSSLGGGVTPISSGNSWIGAGNGGGGAGGYGGNGGGGANIYGCYQTSGSSGAGNGGGSGGGGGGVGLLGNTSNASGAGGGGAGGSNGVQVCGNAPGGAGGLYGGGGGGGYAFGTSTGQNGGVGAGGAVRIVWPGSTRQFPSTCVGSP